jgi:hypothetical protein
LAHHTGESGQLGSSPWRPLWLFHLHVHPHINFNLSLLYESTAVGTAKYKPHSGIRVFDFELASPANLDVPQMQGKTHIKAVTLPPHCVSPSIPFGALALISLPRAPLLPRRFSLKTTVSSLP